MKHTLLLTAVSAALLFTTNANAQIPGVSKVTKALPKVDLGVKLGANFQQLSGNLSKQYNGGVVGGIFVGLHKNRMGVQAEALIKTVKYDVSGTITNARTNSVNTIALDVPVLFEYKLFWHIWAQAGPQFTSLLSAKNGSKDVKSDLNTTDFAGVIGIEAHLPMKLNIGVRYIYGFVDVNKESATGISDAMRNRTIQAYLGFRFL